MGKLTVEIVTPERRLLSAPADEAIVPGADGLFGVRPGHGALLSLMDAGELTLKDGGQTQRYFVAGGFVQVASDTVRVLADQAEPVANIDVSAARQALSDAEAKFKAIAPGDAQQVSAQAAVDRARARVRVATTAHA
jgi:F-type H+-transporting ATPase subunit epsilon